MLVSDFDYVLPPEQIAAEPAAQREDARLLVVNRATQSWEHLSVKEIPSYVQPGDLWTFNDTRVLRARLVADDGRTELLLLEETSPRNWLCLATPAKLTRANAELCFHAEGGAELRATVLRTLDTGERVVRFLGDADVESFGTMPLPPYILKRRAKLGLPPINEHDLERYQTVYNREAGSVAAPTAGLHFTPEMLEKIPHTFVTLHVGLGTFRPIKTENLEDHEMHEERYFLSAETAEALKAAKRRVVVGTTATRVLESLPTLRGARGRTRIFIYPPYTFKHTDVLLTNFHLPRSTLLLLVSAFLENGPFQPSEKFPDGRTFMQAVYADAVKENYRFFSYGDAMLIL